MDAIRDRVEGDARVRVLLAGSKGVGRHSVCDSLARTRLGWDIHEQRTPCCANDPGNEDCPYEAVLVAGAGAGTGALACADALRETGCRAPMLLVLECPRPPSVAALMRLGIVRVMAAPVAPRDLAVAIRLARLDPDGACPPGALHGIR